MKANNILNRILAELSSIREVKFEQMTLENGAVLEAEVFEAGNEVFVVSGEDRVPAPVGEHILSDGRVLVVAEEGFDGGGTVSEKRRIGKRWFVEKV